MNQEEKTFAVLSHVGTLAGYFIVLGNFIVPMVIYMVKNEESDTISDHAKASLNFQLNVLVIFLIALVISFIPFIGWIFGFPLLFLVIGFNVVCVIIATVKAIDGELFKYPIAYPFFD